MKRRTFIATTGLALPAWKLAYAVEKPPRFLFTICANGGASIIDSFLPISQSEAGVGIHSFAPEQLDQSGAFKVVKDLDPKVEKVVGLGPNFSMKTFVNKHGANLLVVCHSVSSVNHQVAAHRSLTGDGANGGKTLGEAVAEAYGQNILLPNITMAQGGFGQHGFSSELPTWARAEYIANPLTFAYSMSLNFGLPSSTNERLERMRAVREKFETATLMSKDAQDYKSKRASLLENLSSGEYFRSLILDKNTLDQNPSFGGNAELNKVLLKFPNLSKDAFQAQAALAFLLAKANLSRSITIDPGANPLLDGGRLITAPIGFDWSHRDHRGAQNAMWSRIISVADGLIDLLKQEPAIGEPGKTLWDQSIVYIATEFGRDKVIGSGGSGHHVNNGSVIISPLIKGSQIAGGVDPKTGLTFGCNLATATIDPAKQLFERDVYSLVLACLGINFKNQTDCRGFIA